MTKNNSDIIMTFKTLYPHVSKTDKELDESDKDESDKAQSSRVQSLNMPSKAACLKRCLPPKIWQRGAAIKYCNA